jgi:hypothetical protein
VWWWCRLAKDWGWLAVSGELWDGWYLSEIYREIESEQVIMLERAGVTLVGEHVKHIAVGRVASAEISAVGFQREDIDINILSPSKVPVLYRWVSHQSQCLSLPCWDNFATMATTARHRLAGWEVSQAVSRNCIWQVCSSCRQIAQFLPKNAWTGRNMGLTICRVLWVH